MIESDIAQNISEKSVTTSSTTIGEKPGKTKMLQKSGTTDAAAISRQRQLRTEMEERMKRNNSRPVSLGAAAFNNNNCNDSESKNTAEHGNEKLSQSNTEKGSEKANTSSTLSANVNKPSNIVRSNFVKVNKPSASTNPAVKAEPSSQHSKVNIQKGGVAGNIVRNISSFIKKETKPKDQKKPRPGAALSALAQAKESRLKQEQREEARRKEKERRRKIIEENKRKKAEGINQNQERNNTLTKDNSNGSNKSGTGSGLPALPPRPHGIGNSNPKMKKKAKEWDPEDNYEISDKGESSEYSSSEESDDARNNKKIPSWARGSKFREALRNQYEGKNRIDPDQLFGEIPVCDLEEIFKPTCSKKKSKYRQRGSSAMWHKDGLTIKEAKQYRIEIGLEKS
mmetsp:Transcript_17226/g.20752  ORF Transcript_17226/g.20752 Transcript_17226/m.20752 type:complete len:397 (-) Transcript_17226:318-1508(-)